MSRENSDPLPPGATIGILGGGQLARMLALAAARLGLETHIYCPNTRPPALAVSGRLSIGEYEDTERVLAFAKACDAITYEFENVPALTAKTAASVVPLRPSARALDVAQDRLAEKSFLKAQVGVEVAGFEDIGSVHDLRRATRRLGLPVVVKTRRFGYDGKGQFIVKSPADIETAWTKLGQAPGGLIVEAFVPFDREVSIVAARGLSGEIKAYPLTENVHRDHILHQSTAPTTRDTGEAQAIAARILDTLDYVGVMGVEFFQLATGELIVNEIAPRVHNSGHWTQDAGCIDQFEQHIRAVAGWPLGDPTPLRRVVMENLIGDHANLWPAIALEPNARLHLYGKREVRPGRKMGHVNRIFPLG